MLDLSKERKLAEEYKFNPHELILLRREFSDSPVVRTPSLNCKGPRFDPWSVN